MEKNPDQTVLTTEEARQGRTPGRVRYILLASMVLIGLAGLGFLIGYA